MSPADSSSSGSGSKIRTGKRGLGSLTTPDEQQQQQQLAAQTKIKRGEMISSREARDRKKIGYTLVVVQCLLNLYHYWWNVTQNKNDWFPVLSPLSQSGVGCFLGSNGILLYQMGRDSQ